MKRSGLMAPEELTSQKVDSQPPSREQFKQRLDEALAGVDDVGYRSNAGMQCWSFMVRVWARRDKAGSARTKWNPMRYAAAVIPVLAAGAGGSLVSHVSGRAGIAIGWVALIAGIIGAAVNAIRPSAEYTVDLTKAAMFEQLYWDAYNYAMITLRSATPDDITATMKDFAKRMQDIAVISTGATATGS